MKKTITAAFSVCLLFSCLVFGEAFAQTNSSKSNAKSREDCITIGMENSFGSYARPDGTGMSRDIAEAAFKAADVCVNFSVLPYAKIVEDIKKGLLLGGFGVAKQYNTVEDFIFGKENLFIVRSYVYVPKGRNTLYKAGSNKKVLAKRPEDLGSGEEIGIINGYEYGKAIDANKKIVRVPVNSQEQNYKKLVEGRLMAAIFFENEIKELRASLKNQELESHIEVAFESTPSIIHIGFSKGQAILHDIEKKSPSEAKKLKAEQKRLQEKSRKYAALLDKGLIAIRKTHKVDGKKTSIYNEIVNKY